MTLLSITSHLPIGRGALPLLDDRDGTLDAAFRREGFDCVPKLEPWSRLVGFLLVS